MSATDDRGEGTRTAVLGTGIMGSAMARNLLRAGLRTTVWDRSVSATAPLAEAGADVAGAFARGAAWAQMGTIGEAASADIARRLGSLRPDVLFVDAPVSGSKGPAEQGQLLILASGPTAAEAVTS